MPHEKDRITSLDRVCSCRSLGQRSGLIASRTVELARKAKDLQLADDLEVVFPDKHLEAAVREELEKPEEPLTKGVIRELTELDASERKVKYLSGLDSAVNLTYLSLYRNQISDVSPLASLTNLTDLRLWGNPLNQESVFVHMSNFKA
mgnify:CR=1 FL=1